MTRKRNNKKGICFILLLLVPLSFCCTNRNNVHVENEDYIFKEIDLNYSIYFQDDLKSMYFLLDQNNNMIRILIFNNKVLTTNYVMKIDKTEKYLFTDIVKEQLMFKRNIDKNKSELNVSFCISLNRDELICKYPITLNFKKDVSPKFNNLMLFLKKQKKIKVFFNEDK